MKKRKEYKAIFVDEKTHLSIKLGATEKGITMGELLARTFINENI
tara:strand:- start:166 stop:300 length:135 start_codon:yes stop_codon:yes gene_type:complete